MNDPIIGWVAFADGCKRDIYQASDGRQYVVDDSGLRVSGVWIIEPDDEADRSIHIDASEF